MIAPTAFDALVGNLVAWHDAATPSQIREGLSWYRQMRAFTVSLAEQHDLPLANVVGALAALSPVTPVDRNMKLAEQVVRTRKGVGHPFSRKALAILASGDLSLLGDRKTRAFADSILSGGRGYRVCFDTWAYRAMTGDILPAKNGRKMHDNASYKQWADNDPGYHVAEAIYREAARRCHRHPGTFQAIVWCAVRGSAW